MVNQNGSKRSPLRWDEINIENRVQAVRNFTSHSLMPETDRLHTTVHKIIAVTIENPCLKGTITEKK